MHCAIKRISIGFPLCLQTSFKTPVNWKNLLNNKDRQCDDAKADTELLETISTAVLQVNELQKSVLDKNEAMNTVVKRVVLNKHSLLSSQVQIQ